MFEGTVKDADIQGSGRSRGVINGITDQDAPEGTLVLRPDGRVLVGTYETDLTVSTSERGALFNATGQLQLANTSAGLDLNGLAGGGRCVNLRYQGGGIVGNISTNATGTNFNTTSDARLKDHISHIENPLDIFDQIPARLFRWVDTGEEQTGFFAQDVEALRSWAVSKDDDEAGTLSLDYSKLVPDLWAGITALKARIEELENGK